MAVPNPDSTVPPPAAGYVDENIIIVNVIPLAAHFDLFSANRGQRSSSNTLAWCEKKSVLLTVTAYAVSNNKTRIIDCLGHGENFEIAVRKIAYAVQVYHLAVRKQKGVNGAVRRRGVSHYLAGSIGAESAALPAAQGSEIVHASLRKQKGVIRIRSGNVGSAAGCSFRICGDRGAACASECPEIIHSATRVQKRVI